VTDGTTNDTPTNRARRVCASCGAIVAGDRCWLCGGSATAVGTVQDQRTAASRREPGSQTFALSSLFLFITLISVCLGVFVAVPGLGILLAILTVPALVRASVLASRDRAQSGGENVGNKVAYFLSSLGVVFLIALAGVASFFAACFVACPIVMATESEGLVGFFMIVAGLIALTVVGRLLYKTWPRRRK